MAPDQLSDLATKPYKAACWHLKSITMFIKTNGHKNAILFQPVLPKMKAQNHTDLEKKEFEDTKGADRNR